MHVSDTYAERYWERREDVNAFLTLKAKYLREDDDARGTKSMRSRL